MLSAADKALGTRRGLSLLFPLSSIWKTVGSFPFPRGNTEVFLVYSSRVHHGQNGNGATFTCTDAAGKC